MLAIINGRVLTAAGQIYEQGTVLIENGKLAAVGALPVPEGAEVLDAAGCWVTPGFIDAHTHIGVQGEPKTRGAGGDNNESTNPATPQARIFDAFDPNSMAVSEARKAGFTTVCVLPGSANVIGGTGFSCKLAPKATVDEMILPGTTVMKFAVGENPRAVYGKDKIKTRMGTAMILRELLYEAKNYSDALLTGEKLPKKEFRLEPLVPVVRGERMCRFHCHRSDDIATVLRIADEFHLKFALEHVTEGFLLKEILAERRVPCIVGPLVSAPYKQEVWARNLRTPGILDRAGVMVSLTEDSGVLTRMLPIHIGLCIKNGLSPEAALRGVTCNPAALLGILDRTGTLEAGKDADVAIWDGDPFCNYTSCRYTVIDGVVFDAEAQNPEASRM